VFCQVSAERMSCSTPDSVVDNRPLSRACMCVCVDDRPSLHDLHGQQVLGKWDALNGELCDIQYCYFLHTREIQSGRE